LVYHVTSKYGEKTTQQYPRERPPHTYTVVPIATGVRLSMSNNLIIYGMPEPPKESADDIRDAHMKLFEDDLHVDTAQNTILARCHRYSRRSGPHYQD